MRVFALALTSIIFPTTALANSISFNLYAHVPLRCQISPQNEIKYGLQFQNDFASDMALSAFSVNSNGRSVSFSIDNAEVTGLSSRDGSKPEIYFLNEKGARLAEKQAYTIESNGTGNYQFRFKIITAKNKSFYIVDNKDLSVLATISFVCNA